MEKLHKLVTLTLLFTLVTTSVYGQNTSIQENEDYSSAYMQSNYTAHWSAYIPLTIIVVAAIYLGIADTSSSQSSSRNSQDGLGSIDSSKRHSSFRSGYSSSSYSSSSSRHGSRYSSTSGGGYSHH